MKAATEADWGPIKMSASRVWSHQRPIQFHGHRFFTGKINVEEIVEKKVEEPVNGDDPAKNEVDSDNEPGSDDSGNADEMPEEGSGDNGDNGSEEENSFEEDD
ncbi:hypothetical protein M8C21_031004 [Ambrosia artemisiifolia]|uniref:Uncharacterized protein n=1 Tax=Ambrosia artemisiifolia TaxID=4212 RepID=A0AAD5D3V3_AMBAR|nr:hypothetical protein M8C21_031004 [Ambrosia artemisiifolia]